MKPLLLAFEGLKPATDIDEELERQKRAYWTGELEPAYVPIEGLHMEDPDDIAEKRKRAFWAGAAVWELED